MDFWHTVHVFPSPCISNCCWDVKVKTLIKWLCPNIKSNRFGLCYLQISDGGRYRIATHTDGSHYTLLLEISNPTVEDGGAYRVIAKNQHGESNANLNLNLAGGYFYILKFFLSLPEPSYDQTNSINFRPAILLISKILTGGSLFGKEWKNKRDKTNKSMQK